MSEFKKYPSTDDSTESLKHRPKSPLNRNWTWSPKAPGTHHIIERVDYKGDDHPMGNLPYEIVEASDNILPKNIEGSDPEKERKEFNEEEIKKRLRALDSDEDEDANESDDIMEFEFDTGSEQNEEEGDVSDEEEHAKAVYIGTQIVLAAIQQARLKNSFGLN